MTTYGLIGYPLSHSFSKQWFEDKFCREAINGVCYNNYPLVDIAMLPALLHDNPFIKGLNVTAPHKESILKYLDIIDSTAAKIGAVNCVINHNGILTGYNVDWIGFARSLQEFIGDIRPKALILGTGGAAKAAAFALSHLTIDYTFVSRNALSKEKTISYDQITAEVTSSHRLIINATPLGTSPETSLMPPIPYDLISAEHFLYDMVYNPAQTIFMKQGSAQGASTTNGLRMLELQAEESWNLFSSVR